MSILIRAESLGAARRYNVIPRCVEVFLTSSKPWLDGFWSE